MYRLKRGYFRKVRSGKRHLVHLEYKGKKLCGKTFRIPASEWEPAHRAEGFGSDEMCRDCLKNGVLDGLIQML